MRISDWSSDVCSSDLAGAARGGGRRYRAARRGEGGAIGVCSTCARSMAIRPPRAYMRLMEQAPAFYYRIGIDTADIDFIGPLNNASYLTWVQEPVISTLRKIAPADAIAEHLWVALQHENT